MVGLAVKALLDPPYKSLLLLVLQQIRFAELAQIDAAAEFAFGEAEPRFQFAQLDENLVELGGEVVAFAGLGHLGVAELPLEGREEVERVAAVARLGDLAFPFAEER